MGDPDEGAAPTRTVPVIGVPTAAFTTLGSPEAVVESASLSLIAVFSLVAVSFKRDPTGDGIGEVQKER